MMGIHDAKIMKLFQLKIIPLFRKKAEIKRKKAENQAPQIGFRLPQPYVCSR